MANYEFVVCSNSFTVKKEAMEDVRKAISCFEKSEVDKEGNAFIGSYGEQNYSDDLKVVRDKRTNKILGTVDTDYYFLEDFLENNGIEGNSGDFEEIDFTKFIQDSLIEGEYCFIKEIGHEKLRYAGADGVLITKDKVTYINLDFIAEKVVKGELSL